MRADYSTGGLTTRANATGGRFYLGVFKYHDGIKWRQRKVILTDDNGKRIPADKAKTRNKKAAERALERARASLGTAVMDSNESVSQYVMDCIEGRRGSVADSTIRGYRDYRKVFERKLANVPMSKLTTKAVRTWIHALIQEGLAPRTIRKAYNLLEGVCDIAVENKDLEANPCTKSLRKELPSAPTRKPNALDESGIRRVNSLLDSCKNPRLRIGARIALHCGLRAQEVCGLRWEDVDIENGILDVRTAIGDRGALRGDAQGATYLKAPKSQAGHRSVPITPTLADELASWRKTQESEWKKLAPEVEFPRTFVIGYADGSWYKPRSLEHAWAKLAQGKHARDPRDRRRYTEAWEPGHEPITGITGDVITFHGLRHTYATVAVKAGTDIKTTSALMGHADASLTLNVYAAADPDAIRAAGTLTAPLLEVGTEKMRLKAV